jgi:hypothetical protein
MKCDHNDGQDATRYEVRLRGRRNRSYSQPVSPTFALANLCKGHSMMAVTQGYVLKERRADTETSPN